MEDYYGILQLSRYIFVAHFRSLDAVMFVITPQPWSMGSDNFLLKLWVLLLLRHRFDFLLEYTLIIAVPTIQRYICVCSQLAPRCYDQLLEIAEASASPDGHLDVPIIQRYIQAESQSGAFMGTVLLPITVNPETAVVRSDNTRVAQVETLQALGQ
ncbi:hypothetical protein VPH35_106416 [Triticum aestivum]